MFKHIKFRYDETVDDSHVLIHCSFEHSFLYTKLNLAIFDRIS